MISAVDVGSRSNRDARKGLELGLGLGLEKVEMVESELEEGEACSYQNHEDFDATVDPDVALSYIDEKLQDVLGHFQKDFEGGVSAENLGAKFGGYGSFLPTYQRSPFWSQPSTPQKFRSLNTPRSPNNIQQEGGQGDAVQFSNGTQSSRLGPGSATSSRLPSVKAPSVHEGIDQGKCMGTTSDEVFNSKSKPQKNKATSLSDQKTLKVRFKMGFDNLPTRKNASIYSGLGLDVSPSSSPDESPSESEGISCGPQGAPFESPTSILETMIDLPMLLLSPLPNDFIELTAKETRARVSIPSPVYMGEPESSEVLPHESNTLKGDIKLSGGKKVKSSESHESKKNTLNDIGVLSRKEQGRDAPTTKALLYSACSFNDDPAKSVDGTCDSLMEANKSMVREKTFSDQAQKEQLDLTSTEVNGFAERKKGGSVRKVTRDKVSLDDISFSTVKDNSQGDIQRGSLSEQDNVTSLVKEHPFPGGKKKSKGSHGTTVAEREKENLTVGTSLIHKAKKSSDDSSNSNQETEDIRVQKGVEKARDTYRDFFGKLEEEDRKDSLETPYEDKSKESEIERKTPTINCGAKGRSGGKKVDKPFTAELYPKEGTNVRCTGNAQVTDGVVGNGVPAMVPPVVVEDNWVQCDRCHKWRLLPVGTNPDNLPEKWLCSMLNWLSDMNRCSFSEDETTKALIALYQGPPPESQRNLQNVSGSFMVEGTVATVPCPDQHQINNDQHAVPGGKKKVVKDISNSANKDGFSPLPSAIKKDLQSSVKSKSLNDVNKSPAVSEANVPGEKHKNKPRVLENNSYEGDIKNMKVKSKWGSDQDYSRLSKKGRSDTVHSTDEEWYVEQRGSSRKAGHSSSNSFPTTSVSKDRPRHKERSSSRDSKLGKERLRVSAENTKGKGQSSLDERSLDFGNYDSVGTKKRKLKDYQDAQTCSTGNPHQQDNRISVQEFSDSRKEKKVRNSKSEGRESSASKGSGRTDKKVSETKNQEFRQNPASTLSQHGLDGMDCLKRDLGSVQASVVATSSSSKVSGSHKTKASFQELKSSPVESVSSSPMRILSTEKFTNRELAGKDDFHDTAALDSPRSCSNGEDDGGSDRSGTAKDKYFTMAHRSNFQNKGVNNMSDSKPNAQTTSHCTNGKYPGTEQQIKDLGEDKPDDVSRTRKSGIESGLKNTVSSIQLQDQSPLREEKHRDGKVNLQEKFGFMPDQSDNIHVGKKDYAGKSESRKNENHLNGGQYFEEVSINAICKQEASQARSHHQLPDCDTERSSKRSLPEISDPEVLGKGKSLSLLSSGGAQGEIFGHCPQAVVDFPKGNGDMEVDPSKVDDMSKLQKKPPKKADHQNGTQQVSSRNSALNGHRSKEIDAPSPMRRDSYSHAANNAVKEAKDLKHLADRLKNSGSTVESTSLYFQAALKFLHGASLLESGNNDNAKHDEMFRSRQMYSSTAKLCEFCAHEYEKSKDMALAALAYKCTEVAYMRVIYSSHPRASRDRHELQAALQMVPLGESPSSSASDVDNVNNSTAADKLSLSKTVNSPQVAGNHIIAARNHPNFVRLLTFAQEMNFAMEASRRSRNAFAAANSSSGVNKHADGISSIKKALDFSFQDVEGLLRLVRLAVEAMNR
ncbi:putative transcription factor & chromatin remodeling CW-Zn family [Lupinus albus]|uniref:Putative transcription factor & chromatin remodeling CW-Zn family n=1 Tax=Lupinus albus TaxID=3870 RepID=A0A6A4PD98_LUPAL|nr:putative transcription factor & chromatin remodeling CW-Zn family [Lupinus albus]